MCFSVYAFLWCVQVISDSSAFWNCCNVTHFHLVDQLKCIPEKHKTVFECWQIWICLRLSLFPFDNGCLFMPPPLWASPWRQMRGDISLAYSGLWLNSHTNLFFKLRSNPQAIEDLFVFSRIHLQIKMGHNRKKKKKKAQSFPQFDCRKKCCEIKLLHLQMCHVPVKWNILFTNCNITLLPTGYVVCLCVLCMCVRVSLYLFYVCSCLLTWYSWYDGCVCEFTMSHRGVECTVSS